VFGEGVLRRDFGCLLEARAGEKTKELSLSRIEILAREGPSRGAHWPDALCCRKTTEYEESTTNPEINAFNLEGVTIRGFKKKRGGAIGSFDWDFVVEK